MPLALSSKFTRLLAFFDKLLPAVIRPSELLAKSRRKLRSIPYQLDRAPGPAKNDDESLTIETIENADSTMDAVRPGYHDTLLPESGDTLLPESGETAFHDAVPIFMQDYTPLPMDSALDSHALSSIVASTPLEADPRSIYIDITINVAILLFTLGVGVVLGRLTKGKKARNSTTKTDDPRARFAEHPNSELVQDQGGRPPVRRYVNVPQTLASASGEAMLSPAYLEEQWANMERARQRRQHRQRP